MTKRRARGSCVTYLVARYVTTLSATLVVNGEGVPHIDNLARKLDDAFGDYALYISPNTAKTNVILGDTVRLVRGRERAQNLGKFSFAGQRRGARCGLRRGGARP